MRISFQILLANALLVTQLASASSGDDAKLRAALVSAMKTHDSVMVQAVANSGHESIDNDAELQEQIKSYFANEEAYQKAQQQRAKAAAKKRKKEKKRAAAKKAQPKQKVIATETPVVEQISLERDDDTAQKEAEAQRAEAARQKQQKETEAKLAQETQSKKDAAARKAQHEKLLQQAKADKVAAEKQRAKRLAQEEAARVKAAAEKEKARKALALKKEKELKARKAKIAEDKRIQNKKSAAAKKPLTVSMKKLIGTWKEVNSDKVVTMKISKDGQFTLEQVEEDGTLSLAGTWKSEEDIFILNIKQVQRNVHTRETDIHRVYKVVTLNKKQLVLHDKRDRVAYNLSR